MQVVIREAGPEDLSDDQRLMFDLITEGGVAYDTPFSSETLMRLFIAGETTFSELVYTAGMKVMARFAIFASEPWAREVDALLFATDSRRECDAQRPDTIAAMCADGVEGACDSERTYPERDVEKVAEACEMVPYLIFCDPEDPPPFDPPET